MKHPPLLLCTDLDRTLLPNGEQPESRDVRRLFAQVAADPDVVLVYVTGRDRGRVEDAIRTWHLPRPDLVVADVGTTLYDLRSGEWDVWGQWAAELAPDWAGLQAHDLAALLKFEALQLQDPSRQGPFKLSYLAPMEVDRERLDAEISALLSGAGVRANLIWSVDPEESVTLLDIVPLCADKHRAVEFLRAALGFSLRQTLFAGDSGNDLSLMASEVPSVLVANASSEVAEQAVQMASSRGNEATLFLARGGWNGTNGNYAAGILEGLAHFHPERSLDLLLAQPPEHFGGGR